MQSSSREPSSSSSGGFLNLFNVDLPQDLDALIARMCEMQVVSMSERMAYLFYLHGKGCLLPLVDAQTQCDFDLNFEKLRSGLFRPEDSFFLNSDALTFATLSSLLKSQSSLITRQDVSSDSRSLNINTWESLIKWLENSVMRLKSPRERKNKLDEFIAQDNSSFVYYDHDIKSVLFAEDIFLKIMLLYLLRNLKKVDKVLVECADDFFTMFAGLLRADLALIDMTWAHWFDCTHLLKYFFVNPLLLLKETNQNLLQAAINRVKVDGLADQVFLNLEVMRDVDTSIFQYLRENYQFHSENFHELDGYNNVKKKFSFDDARAILSLIREITTALSASGRLEFIIRYVAQNRISQNLADGFLLFADRNVDHLVFTRGLRDALDLRDYIPFSVMEILLPHMREEPELKIKHLWKIALQSSSRDSVPTISFELTKHFQFLYGQVNSVDFIMLEKGAPIYALAITPTLLQKMGSSEQVNFILNNGIKGWFDGAGISFQSKISGRRISQKALLESLSLYALYILHLVLKRAVEGAYEYSMSIYKQKNLGRNEKEALSAEVKQVLKEKLQSDFMFSGCQTAELIEEASSDFSSRKLAGLATMTASSEVIEAVPASEINAFTDVPSWWVAFFVQSIDVEYPKVSIAYNALQNSKAKDIEPENKAVTSRFGFSRFFNSPAQENVPGQKIGLEKGSQQPRGRSGEQERTKILQEACNFVSGFNDQARGLFIDNVSASGVEVCCEFLDKLRAYYMQIEGSYRNYPSRLGAQNKINVLRHLMLAVKNAWSGSVVRREVELLRELDRLSAPVAASAPPLSALSEFSVPGAGAVVEILPAPEPSAPPSDGELSSGSPSSGACAVAVEAVAAPSVSISAVSSLNNSRQALLGGASAAGAGSTSQNDCAPTRASVY